MNVTTVTISSGIPSSGSGTVSTIDNMLGSAGTPNTNVLSVQGITSGTPVSVSGTFFQATQTVTGTVGVTGTGQIVTLSSTTVNVGNTVTVTGTVTTNTYSTVAISNTSFVLSGTANSVSVSGTVPVSGAFFQTNQPIIGVSGGTAVLVSLSSNVISGTVTVNTQTSVTLSGTANNVSVSGNVPIIGVSGGTAVLVSLSSNTITGTVALSSNIVTITGTGAIVTISSAIPGTSNVSVVGTPTVTVASVTGTVNVAEQNASAYPNRTSWVYGTATTATAAAATIITSGGGTTKLYITSMQAYNSGTTAVRLALNDSISSIVGLGITNPQNISFQTPLTMSTTTAFTVTPSATSTTIVISAQGYKAA